MLAEFDEKPNETSEDSAPSSEKEFSVENIAPPSAELIDNSTEI